MPHKWLSKPRMLAVAPMLVVLILGVACGGGDATSVPTATVAGSQPTTAPTAVPEPTTAPDVGDDKYGGIFALHKHGDARILDPHVSSSGTEQGTFDFLYSQLTATANGPPNPSEIVGDVAASWDVADGGMAYVFKLKDNVQFSDGMPLTAHDVVANLDRIVMPGEARPKSGLLRNYYEGSEASDDHTVKVNLTFPAAAFLPALSHGYMKILPKHLIDADFDFAKNRDEIVGSGPYIFEDYRKSDSFELTRNPNYHKDGLPYPDGIKQFIITDTGRTIAAFEAEQVLASSIGWTGLSTQDHLELDENNSQIDAMVVQAKSSNGLFINVEHEPLNDPKVRKALFLMMDRAQHVKIFSLGKGEVHGGLPSWLPIGMSQEDLAQRPGFRYTADGMKDPRDIEAAKALLAEAGLSDGFELEITVRQTGQYADQAAVVKDQWGALGVNATIRSLESAAGFAAYDAKDFEVGIINTSFTITDPDAILGTLYMPNGDINYAHWQNDTLDDLFTQQAQEPDLSNRARILSEVDELLLGGEHHYVGIMWTPAFYTVNRQVQGFHLPPTTSSGLVYEKIWLEK